MHARGKKTDGTKNPMIARRLAQGQSEAEHDENQRAAASAAQAARSSFKAAKARFEEDKVPEPMHLGKPGSTPARPKWLGSSASGGGGGGAVTRVSPVSVSPTASTPPQQTPCKPTTTRDTSPSRNDPVETRYTFVSEFDWLSKQYGVTPSAVKTGLIEYDASFEEMLQNHADMTLDASDLMPSPIPATPSTPFVILVPAKASPHNNTTNAADETTCWGCPIC